MTFSNRPLYLQVRDALAGRIASGGLPPGAAIPSESDLAREIGVSAGTVRKALQLMETDRLIVRRQGRGTFVSNPSAEEFAARFARLHGANGARIRGQIKSTEITRGPANDLERARLQLPSGEEVYRVRRVHHHDGTPFLLEDAIVPADLFPGLDGKSRVPDNVGVLAQEYCILIGHVQERVSSAVPPPAVATALRAAPGVAVVMLDRVVTTLDSARPVEWRLAYSYLPGSYYLAELR